MDSHSTTLKRIPGPSLLEAIRGLRQHDFLTYIGQLWQAYGDIFQLRLGPRTLIFVMHPEAVRHINITNRQNYDKLKSYDTVRRYLIGEGLVASTGELWRRQRKLMSPFFTPRGVQAYAEIMLADGIQLLERWEGLAQSGRTIEMSEEMTLVTASIILKAMFSTETDDAIVEMKDAVETMISFGNNNQAGVRLPLWFPTSTNRQYQAARNKVHSYINALIAQRRSLPEDQWPEDLLTHLMQARDEDTGERMVESLLRDESITTFFAGHETTARTMSAAWYALASNSAVARQLQAELDAVLGDRYPTVEDLHHLPYTLQVIKEVLRLYPPAPFYARDAVGDDALDGYLIPAGSAVMLSPYYTHRHPDFWNNPEQFDPDRWTSEREAARHTYAYHPFATGQRICIGNNFSLLESHILLALLAKHFAPRLAADYTPQWVMNGVLSTANGLPMLIKAR
ncbi:MAG: cytochrome P450 [Anaerolineales bacterium]|nr:cytochrome P450 [Anaerolineales bacterium]